MLAPLVNKLNDLRVVLASGSEQRANLLRSTKLKFEVHPSNFEENLDPKQHTFSEFVENTALGKVKDVWLKLEHDPTPPDIIIGADTMVTYNGRMYGKPKTKTEAFDTIKDLTQDGLPNAVYTGVVIKYRDEFYKFTEVTSVHMLKLTDDEILSYINTGEPMCKAGGYGIQGIAGTFVRRIEGDCNNVIGLPMTRLAQHLKRILHEESIS